MRMLSSHHTVLERPGYQGIASLSVVMAKKMHAAVVQEPTLYLDRNPIMFFAATLQDEWTRSHSTRLNFESASGWFQAEVFVISRG